MKSSTTKMMTAMVAAAFLSVSASGIAFANEARPAAGAPTGISPVVIHAPAVMSVPAATAEKAPAPDVIRREMKVSGYQLVKVNGNFKVYLQQGDEQKIVVEADESLVPEVKHFIVDNTLNIYTSDDVKKRITLWVTLKDINNLNKFGNVRVIRK